MTDLGALRPFTTSVRPGHHGLAERIQSLRYPFRQAVESSGRPMEPGVHSEPITFLSGRLPLLSAHRSTV